MLRAIAAMTLFNVSINGLNLLTGAIVARMLGPAGRGELAIAMLWPSILAGFMVLGLDVIMARKSASAGDFGRRWYEISLLFSISFGAASGCILWLLLPWILPDGMTHLIGTAMVLILFIPASILTVLLSSIELGRGKFLNYNLIRISFYAVYALFLLSIYIAGAGNLEAVVYSFVLAANIVAVGSFLSLYVNSWENSGIVVRKLDLLRASIPFALLAGISTLTIHAPTILLSFLADEEFVGLFIVAFLAASLHLPFTNSVGKSLFSLSARSSLDQVCSTLPSLLRELMIFSLLVITVMFPILPYFVVLIFGHEFEAAGNMAANMVPATVILALSTVIEDVLKGIGRAKPSVYARICGTIGLLVTGWFLVPEYGLHGMVMAVYVRAMLEFIFILSLTILSLRLTWFSIFRFSMNDVSRLINRVRHISVRGK